ncbi:MAG: hypothetical protein H6937_09570 [Burkholderiales bacterium]|nr:hypothetical protein [Burkholderiales bacterium]
MIPVSVILTVLRNVLPIVAVLSVLGWGLWSAYDWAYSRGYEAREDIAIEAERDLLKQQQSILAKRISQERERRELDKQHLIEVLDAERQRNEDLQRDIDNFDSQRLFVTVKEKSDRCVGSELYPGGDTGTHATETGYELSDRLSEDVREAGIEAQKYINQLNTLIDFIEKNQGECLEIVK